MHLTDANVVILLCLGLLTSAEIVSSDGSVGCLFSKSLCKPAIEWCYDDYAFGRCLPRYEGKTTDLDFYQYDLKGNSLHLLKQELERLMNLGYRWSHFYTQCVLKALLFAFRYQNEYNENTCRAFSEDDQKPALTFFEGNLEKIDPKNVGQVQFTPSVVDPHAEYADEIYIPVFGGDSVLEEVVVPEHDARAPISENYINDLQRALSLAQINKNKRSKNKHRFEIAETEELEDEISPNYLAYLSELANEETSDSAPYLDYIEPVRSKFHFTERYNTPDHFRAGLESRDYDKDVDLSILENIFVNDRNILKSFSRDYNTPERFRKGHETKDEVFYPRMNPENGYLLPEERQFAYDTYNGVENDEYGRYPENEDGVYTEGGVVYLKDEDKGESGDTNTFEDLMNTYNNWGFKRPERLDVKKPGPSFSTNNYAFKNEKENVKDNAGWKGIVKSVVKTTPKPEPKKSDILTQPEKKKVGSPMESPTLRRQTTTVPPPKEKTTGESDGGYAYIVFKNRVNTWQEGSRIVRKVEDLLRLNPNTFTNVKVDQNEVRFRVDANRFNLNASDIVSRIEGNKDLIQKAIGVEVVSTGVGDQVKLPPTMSLLGGDERQLWILSFLLCGVIAAVAIAGAALFVIKRHSHTRDKLQNLTQLDSEASKDYQDLCRARMATKTAQEKPEGNVAGHRVTNLARESEGSNHSPSSRSSTSSWSEEPALTNMDISTGHMVLSYMEDHLKNKDRLEQEWIALCAYEAEPCATTIAVKGENGKKNRYTDVLPYDHARVVLNELSNISGSDYINASTITDHDPRNPAYIATQGPLPNTAADFWQMVWEQGSVVMVMLTRLTENGTGMCHRYWPEEGSELYHIYEVHLVSEHIWCDDYLVRSFYLKNLKTGETRTVTQFHFLSWPENGIPLSTKALLEFRRKVNKSYRGRSCPIVVHCSDGVGRTGTYCLIDMVLNRMAKGAKEIDIAATLEHIRDQRPLMVRTKQQFEFVLMAVAEEVHAILKALPTNPNHSPPPVLKEKE